MEWESEFIGQKECSKKFPYNGSLKQNFHRDYKNIRIKDELQLTAIAKTK